MNKILIFFATYNEAGNVIQLLSEIANAVPTADILVIDDNSSDGTADLLRSQSLDNLVVIERKGKLGLGTAHLLALLYAHNEQYDVVVTMDGDLSHDPRYIPALLEKISAGFDLSIGSRYMQGGSCDYTGYRLYVSKLGNIAARALLRIKLHEFTTSYRAFRVPTLGILDFNQLLVGGYSFFLTMISEASSNGLKIAEAPIHFRERSYGVSKIPTFEIFRGMSNLLRLALKRTKHKKTDFPHSALVPCRNCGTSYSFISRLLETSNVAKSNSGVCVYCGHIEQ